MGACGARTRLKFEFPRACKPARACACPDAATREPPASRRETSTSSPTFSRTRFSIAAATIIYTTVPITVTEAALGAKIEVPTIDGRSLLRVPPGTNSGQKLRLREKGVPSVRTPGHRGDQYVELQVMVPKPVDERVRELLKELEKIAPEDPRKDLFDRAKA